MTNLDFKKLVNKYAIILIISYGLTFLLGLLLQGMFSGTSGGTGRNESNHEKYSFDFSVLHQHRDFFDNN